ncbi:MAG: hypothetical protein AAB795_00595 [Patescibacteria group bacterium]
MGLRQKLIVMLTTLALFLLPAVSYAGFDFFGGKITARFDVDTETFLKVSGKSGSYGFNSTVWAVGPMKSCSSGQYILGWGVIKKVVDHRIIMPIVGICK